MRRRHRSAAPFVLAIVTVGLVALVVVLVCGVVVVRQLAEAQAVAQARRLTQIDAREVQERITDRMVTGRHPRATARLSTLLEQIVKPDSAGPVVRVKIWRADGRVGEIVSSDLPELIGLRQPLEDDHLDALTTGAMIAEMSALDREENRYEQGYGPLSEVYTRIVAPDGTPLLFETYQSSAAIIENGREIARTFTPVVIVTLLIAAVLQSSLAVALIRRFRRHQREREALMQAATDASARERRRIAGDLHDGPVQHIAGLCLTLAAEAETETDDRIRDRLLQMGTTMRASLRSLRSAIVGIYPPNLEQTGLEAALSDLLAGLATHRLNGHLAYGLDQEPGKRTSELLYRTGQEAIRNIEKHAAASNVWVTVQRRNGRVALSVRDDGRGGATINDRIADTGHFGLAVLVDIIHDAGGQMRLVSDSTGTTVQAELPAAGDR